MAPFFGEHRIDARPKPGFLLAPTQTFRSQDHMHSTVLHRNPLHLIEIPRQPLKRTGSERLPQVLRIGQSGGNYHPHLVTGVNGGTTGARLIHQPAVAVEVEARDPAANELGSDLEGVGNVRHTLSLACQLNHSRPFDNARRLCP
jgi:hypothetical protein